MVVFSGRPVSEADAKVYSEHRSKMRLGAKMKFLLCLFHFARCFVLLVDGQDTLVINSTLNFNVTLLSPGGVFEVGFTASGGSSSLVYTLAIWFAQSPARTVVWVADRSMALSSIDGAFVRLSAEGNLQVYNSNSSKPVWTSNTNNMNVTSAAILDTGNLVLRDGLNQVMWQSFDRPTDTLLPGQVFSAHSTKIITAWQDDGDWSEGRYSLKWTTNASGIFACWQNPYNWYASPNYTYWPSPEWDPNGKIKLSHAVLTPTGEFRLVGSNSTVIAAASPASVNSTRLLRLTLDIDGNIRIYSWAAGMPSWKLEWKALDQCAVSGYCGPNAICGEEKCVCPTGFRLLSATDTRLGCERTTPVTCVTTTDTFAPVQYADWGLYADWGKGPDMNYYESIDASTCMERCLAVCECQVAVMSIPNFANESTVECWLKRATLLNGTAQLKRQSFLRIAASEDVRAPPPDQQRVFPNESAPSQISRQALKVVASAAGAAAVILALLACAFGGTCCISTMEKQRRRRLERKWVAAKGSMIRFTYREILNMTGSFKTKIGEGGFGTVFKGQIGRQTNSPHTSLTAVAVKRLNQQLTSQIEKEFLKEVDSIGLIHHVHLVSLLGYCAEADHRLLVYEYVDRGSLDRALFHKSSPVLEWRPRFAIAVQTARGLAYLHDDCNQQIIHCDVKPENILLDSMYSAKVADFGLSRIMNHDQTRIVTKHICGTYGYLAPDWMSDRVTNKVDVFSFGMVLLEIIGGRRNVAATPSKDDSPEIYFPTWAFPKISTDAFLEVVDPALTGIVNPDEVRRALLVAFWCINDKPHLRPSMSEVVQMLQGSVSIELPVPKPEFFNNVEFPVEFGDGDNDSYSSVSRPEFIVEPEDDDDGIDCGAALQSSHDDSGAKSVELPYSGSGDSIV